MSPFQVLLVLAWVITAVIAAMLIGKRKGRRWTGFTLGLLLGWIGVIIVAVLPPTHDAQVRRERERLQVQREASGGTWRNA